MDFNENRTNKQNLANTTEKISEPQKEKKGKNNKGLMIGILAVLGTILLGAIVWGIIWMLGGNTEEKTQQEIDKEAAEKLAMEQQLAQSELENATHDLVQLEGQNNLNFSDTTQMRLRQQYEAARAEVERLQTALKDSKNKSAAEISKLRAEIESLRKLLKHYLEEIARLNRDNEQLRGQVDSLSTNLAGANARNEALTQSNQRLNEENELAKKLNITGINLTPLNKKGNREKKLKKTQQFKVTFSIAQNPVAPVGYKDLYVRLISPEGQLLGGGGSFPFEGASVPCSASKKIEYDGSETAVSIFVDINSALTAGDYTVEIFADGYRLARPARFHLK